MSEEPATSTSPECYESVKSLLVLPPEPREISSRIKCYSRLGMRGSGPRERDINGVVRVYRECERLRSMPPLGSYWYFKSDGSWKAGILRDFLEMTEKVPNVELTLYSFYDHNTKIYVIIGQNGRPLSITDLSEGQRLLFGTQIVQTVFDVTRIAIPNDITDMILSCEDDFLPDFFELPPTMDETFAWNEDEGSENEISDEKSRST